MRCCATLCAQRSANGAVTSASIYISYSCGTLLVSVWCADYNVLAAAYRTQHEHTSQLDAALVFWTALLTRRLTIPATYSPLTRACLYRHYCSTVCWLIALLWYLVVVVVVVVVVM